jgi:hypothetical protein
MLEVQHDVDAIKQRRWPLAASVLLDEHRAMGELLVLTHRRRVARWAAHAIVWRGPYGTRLALEPLVLWVNLDAAEQLLREKEPELALVAAWALQGKCGPRSKALAVHAMERTADLPDPVRAQQGRAIMQLLSAPLRQHLHAMMLKDLDKVPQSKSFKKFLRSIEGPAEERGKAEGLRVAVLDACELLGIVLTEAQRAQLEAMGVAELEALRHELKQTRRWPG